MAEILLFHHIQGRTPGVEAFGETLRRDGHTVHAPDLFDGRTFESIADGLAFAQSVGFDVLRERGLREADGLPNELVYAGFSFGVMIAQELAQTRAGARGALFYYSCLPAEEFGTWPADLPAQIHAKRGDEFFAEDADAATALATEPNVELFIYEGDQHLFADDSLAEYDPVAALVLMERTRTFLTLVDQGSR